MKKIFFVSYGGGHAQIIKHLYKRIAEVENVEPVLLALTTSIKIFDQENIKYHTYMDYLDLLENKSEVIKWGEFWAKTEYDYNSGIPYEQIVAYLGVGICDYMLEYGVTENEVKKVFEEKKRTIFCPLHSMRKIMEYERPDVVVLTCGVRSEKAAGIVANEMGIPVVRVLDLMELREMPYDATVCVMNEWTRENVNKCKNIIGNNEVVVTGQPVFEHNTKLDNDKCKEAQKYFEKEKYENIVIYLESPGIKEQKIIEQEIQTIAKKRSKDLFIIKLHPNQSQYELSCELDNVIIEREYELKYLLHLADLAITGYSTSGLEAALLGKPLIVTDLLNVHPIDFSKYGIAKKVEDITMLNSVIEECLDINSQTSRMLSEGREKFFNKQNATDNIVKMIVEKSKRNE